MFKCMPSSVISEKSQFLDYKSIKDFLKKHRTNFMNFEGN